ncbi:MAG: NAD(P)H-hydrate dehydratase [Pseudomonadales bacterium]|nr:NAD(P)H-hydrate dehydratase [Pseudomonadales bacterium]
MLEDGGNKPLYTGEHFVVAQHIVSNGHLYTADQSRQVDNNTIESGVAGFALMQKAGLAAFQLIQQYWPGESLYIFCGGGNNGGDGFVIATLAKQQGISAKVYFVGRAENLVHEAAAAYQMALQSGVDIQTVDNTGLSHDAFHGVLQEGLVVDALLGTGIQQRPRPMAASIINVMNNTVLPILSIDIPSGLNSDTGIAMAEVVRADKTLSFITQKRGLYLADGPKFAGQRYFDDLNAPDEVYDEIFGQSVILLDLPTLLSNVPARDKAAHKGSMGHVAVVGGEVGMSGAAILTATAAARMGAGLTTLASRAETVNALLIAQPEIMAKVMTEASDISALLAKASVVAIGPGLGQLDWAQALLSQVAACNLPQVCDADALNVLAQQHHRSESVFCDHRIITPHPGEAARLLDVSTTQVQADRIAAVQKLQNLYGGIAVLKGAGTLVCWQVHDEQHVALCPYGNAAMASGGMGDVLTGVIAGLLAQRDLSHFQAHFSLIVCLAVCLHGAAADDLAEIEGERGLLAGDLIGRIRQRLNNLT